MPNKTYPCLWFNGQAKAAADFYCGVFSDSTILVDSPMVVNWELNGLKLMSNPATGEKVMQELLKMRKLDLAILEKAAEG